MFVPEVELLNWSDFRRILQRPSKVKVYLYHWETLYSVRLVLQVFDGTCVYTHREPVYQERHYTIADEPVDETPLRESEKYKNAKSLDEVNRIERQWWKFQLQQFLDSLKLVYDFMEGRISSVCIATQEG